MKRDTSAPTAGQAELERRQARFRRPSEWTNPPPLPGDDGDVAVHASAPPVVQRKKLHSPESTKERLLRVDSAPIQLDIKPPVHSHKESTSWISSVILHAVVVFIIALLVAPADYGGVDPLKIYLSWSENQQPEALDLSVEIDTNNEALAEPESMSIETPVIVAKTDTAPAEQPRQGSQKGNSDSEGRGKASAGPRGSFFGIEAVGHEFVYIVDTSGSMSGRRYRRASEELIRSVSELQEDQHFYVFLFGNVTHQMFDQNDAAPTSIPATQENKTRLARWIRNAFKGGNTDPRGALKTALKMNPSAIFMLSDGKFNGSEKNLAPGMFRGNANAFSIVRASMSKSPIHAIAFENRNSCENMKRLADLTNGSYRFAAKEDDPGASVVLDEAVKAEADGKTRQAKKLLEKVVSAYPQSESAWKARQRLNEMVESSAQESIRAGDLPAVTAAIEEMIRIDPTGSASTDSQTKVVNEMLSQSKAAGEKQYNETLKTLGELSSRHLQSRVLRDATEPLAQAMFDAAKKLQDSHPIESYRQFQTIRNRFKASELAAQSMQEQEAITASLLAQAREKRNRGGAQVMSDFLKELRTRSEGTTLVTPIETAIDNLALDLMADVRDAIRQRNAAAMNAANVELQNVIADAGKRERLKREFLSMETKAREMLRKANRQANAAGLENAVVQYQGVIESFPKSLAAGKARERLREADRLGDEEDVDADAAKMLELMLQ